MWSNILDIAPVNRWTVHSLNLCKLSVFAFVLSYVSAMVPVKSAKEYGLHQDIIVLFSETTVRYVALYTFTWPLTLCVQFFRATRLKFISVEMIESCDPALMFTIPRLAIIAGLLIYPDGPLRVDQDPLQVPEMFRHFLRLLSRIKYVRSSCLFRQILKLAHKVHNAGRFKSSPTELVVNCRFF